MTTSFNPIISEEQVPRLTLFQPRPAPEPGIALVLYREGQRAIALWPGDRMTAGEVRWGRYKKIYKVDVAEHFFSFDCTLPCQSDAFDFQAQAQVTYAVNNPAAIVENKVTNARAVLEPLITDAMREVSRRYDVEKSETAEREIAKTVKSKPHDMGFELKRFVVNLRLEADARAYLRQLRQYDRDKVLASKDAELQKQLDQLEMDRLKIKMEFYGPLIKQGQWQLLSMQLSNRPEDLPGIIQMLDQQRQLEMKHQLEALKIMLDEDAIEGFQLEDTGKRVLRRLVDSLGTLDTKSLMTPPEPDVDSND